MAELPIGEIPAGWRTRALADLCSKIGSGATPRGGGTVYVEKGTAFIRSQNIYDNEFSWDGLAYIDDDAAEQLKGVTVQARDVLLNITGDSILRTCCAPARLLPARVSQHVAIIRTRDELDPLFLQKYLTLPSVKEYMLGHSAGGTRKAITKGHIEGFLVPVPPLAEQQAIAGVLGALDDKIESNRRLSWLLESEARLHFAQLFETDPGSGELPLSKLVDINPKRQLRAGSSGTYVGMSVLPTASALIEEWESQPAGSGQRFMNGDVLLARITPCLENGKTAYVDVLGDEEVGWGSTEYIVLRSKKPLPLEWAYCLARSEGFVEFAVRNMTGTSGRQRCPSTAFGAYFLQEPSDSAVATFASQVKGAFLRMGKARDESRTLRRLRDALLPEMLSGRLRVAAAETFVEELV